MKTRSIIFFLLNTLRNIKSFRNQLYYCVQLQPRCLICEICREFQSVEYDLYENMFCLDFLGRVHSYLHDYLEKIFLSKRCLCLILNNEYSYVWKDWFTGENYRVSLKDAITHKENHDINIIKIPT